MKEKAMKKKIALSAALVLALLIGGVLVATTLSAIDEQ